MFRSLIITPDKLNNLFRLLEEQYQHHRGAYFYRGHPHQDYLLRPSAFRPDKIKQMSDRFISRYSISALAFGEKAKALLVALFVGNVDYVNWFMCTESYRRVVAIIDFLMKYNFNLSEGVENYEKQYDSKSCEHKKHRPSTYWQSEDAFYNALWDFVHGLTFRISKDATKVYKEPYLHNDMTPFDESLPQHYEHAPTAKLDWTYNPFIGFFFALPNKSEHDTSLINANHMYRSLYVCEKPKAQGSKEPILFTEDYVMSNENNRRIIRQQGLFAVMPYPITFYWQYGRWPCLEDCFQLMSHELAIMRYDISISLTPLIRSYLDEKQITEENLLPKLVSI